TRSWRGILPFTHLAREGRMTVTIGRRELLAALGGPGAAWPLAAHAQQPGKLWRIAFITQAQQNIYETLFERLRELGYEEGQNTIIERRYAEGRTERFREFAAEMVRLKADLIITITTPAALAAKNATTTTLSSFQPLLTRWAPG